MATKKTPAPRIQDAPAEGNFTRAEIQAAVKVARKTVVKKNIDPGRPVSRPMAPESTNTNWGKTLTKAQWVKLMKKLDSKKKQRESKKLSDKKK